jgi:hypothetical protein
MTFPLSRALLTAICVFAPTLAAATPAAIPLLSGSYSMNVETLCPAVQTVNSKGKSLKLTPKSPGEITHTAGTLNFLSSGFSGNFKWSVAVTDGSAIVSTVNGKTTGAPFQLVDGQNFGQYAEGHGELTLTFDQQKPMKFVAVYGQGDANDITHKVNLLMVSDSKPACATDMILSLQADSGR